MHTTRLNEVHSLKDLQPDGVGVGQAHAEASMKCSSRRNHNSLRTSCPLASLASRNEVQFPKELQHELVSGAYIRSAASMKCSSRKNCNVENAPL